MKNRFLSFLLVSILFLGLSVFKAESALTIEFKTFPELDNTYIDVSNYPLFRAKLKAIYNGNPVNLIADNINIVENDYSSKPRDISAPDGQGFQTITWASKMKGPLKYVDVMVLYNNEVSARRAPCDTIQMSQMRIDNLNNKLAFDYHFGTIPAGTDTLGVIKTYALMAKMANGRELPIKIDSVKTHTPYFEYEWKGSLTNQTLPPLNIYSPTKYKVYLKFKPKENRYYQDKFSVYYDGGGVEEVNLTGNFFNIETNTLLNLIEPNGGQLLAPCENYLIKWKGSLRDIPTLVELTTDGGTTWSKIAEVYDTVYNWKVPNISTDNAFIRVRQEFQNTEKRSLKANNTAVRKIAYTNEGSNLIDVNDAGEIFEWDIINQTKSLPYQIPDVNYPSRRILPLGLFYLSGDQRFAVAYITTWEGKMFISYFDKGNYTPANTVEIQRKYSVRSVIADSKKQFIAVVPSIGNLVELYNANDASFNKSVNFPDIITSFVFSKWRDEAVVSMYDGEVEIVNLPDFSVQKSFDYSTLPIILQANISADGKLLAIGCKAPRGTAVSGNINQIHIIDVGSDQIVRTLRRTASDPVGLEFSPTSNMLLIGSEAQPQIIMWDLIHNEYIGDLGGNDNLVTDFQFAPDGHSVAVSGDAVDNLIVRFFTYPEQDSSDASFRIAQPQFKIVDVEIPAKYLATYNEQLLETNFCNEGEVPFEINFAYFADGKHFHLASTITPDTLYPGDCLKIPIVFNPLDTGWISDDLILSTCIGDFKIHHQSYSIIRHISFYSSDFDFDSLCIGSSIDKEIILAKNDDPVPLKINNISVGPPFRLIPEVKDTILQPGESIKVTIRYSPTEVGESKSKLFIFHSDQQKFLPETLLSGYGLGTLLQISHPDLMFVPENLTRTFKVKNQSKNPINVEEYNFSQTGLFSFITPLPLSLESGEEGDITVVWNGNPFTDKILLTLIASPCYSENNINLRLYNASTDVSLPVVDADPHGEAIIPVNFYTNYENYPYKGIRTFNAEFTINPRVFLPQEVLCDYGDGTITRNEIINDRRIIGISVEGDFPNEGVVAYIKGIAGIAEIDTSHTIFTQESTYWGTSVATISYNGLFRLINLCGDRRIVEDAIAISSIIPNPVSDKFTLEFESKSDGDCDIEIYDYTGNITLKIPKQHAIEGINSIIVDSSTLPTGAYNIVIRINGALATSSLIILR